jgi:hypothetical protein
MTSRKGKRWKSVSCVHIRIAVRVSWSLSPARWSNDLLGNVCVALRGNEHAEPLRADQRGRLPA